MGHALAQGLELMVFGMGGVFAVLLLIYVVCIALNKIFPGDTDQK